MATWPSKFPKPQRVGYGSTAELPFTESTFPSGSKRRRIDETVQQVYGVQVRFPDTEIQYFWSWLRHKTGEGTEVIEDFPFRDGNSITNIDCYIDKNTIQQKLRGNYFYVNFSVRVPQITTPSEGALDTWLAS